MFLPFSDVRHEALLSLYRLTYSSEQQEHFTKDEVSEKADTSAGPVFFGRVLDALVADGLVRSAVPDDEIVYYYLTNDGWSAAEKIVFDKLRSGDPSEGVPASDRVVTITDNQRSEINSAVDELIVEINTSNEAGDILFENKDRVTSELQSSQELITAKTVRLGAIVGLLAAPLRYLAEKFSGAAVGELAKKLLDVLWKMISN